LNNQQKEYYKDILIDRMDKIITESKRLKIIRGKEDEVFAHYDEYEKILWGKMIKKVDDYLDHHKVAAALCCSVMKARPIYYTPDKTGKATHFEEKANEYCAFILGLQVVENFWEAKSKENIPAKDKDIYNNNIMLPLTNKESCYEDYFEDLLSLDAFKRFDYEDSKFGESLIFIIAHIYFLIDSYSSQYYKRKGEKKSF